MIFLNKDNKESLYMQIYHQVRKDIISGTIKEGDVLAGSRGLARTLGVSRNTVDNAYSQLLAEGYIIPKRGVGYIVTRLPELNIYQLRQAQEFTKQEFSNNIVVTEDNVIYDLTNGSHTNDLFPKTLRVFFQRIFGCKWKN